ncbi:hypothetical protein BGP_6193 [Beggiatoa sp. PS]|nr:hypothetical protein BGP_6193 [Beggiatoa sp. PS]
MDISLEGGDEFEELSDDVDLGGNDSLDLGEDVDMSLSGDDEETDFRRR